jgi:adenosylhomocysteine nucleosidase
VRVRDEARDRDHARDRDDARGGAGGGRLAIVSPLREELAALVSRTTERRRLRTGDGTFVLGRLAGSPVVLATTGDGAAAAARGLAALFAAVGVDRLLVVGVAGALSPGLALGELIASRRVWEGGEAAPEPDAGWLARALASGLAAAGTLVTSDVILTAPATRRALWQRAGGEAPATVDLESAVYARLAAARGVPYLVARAVVDVAEETLAIDFERCRGADGRIRRAAVVGQALAAPRRLGSLVELARRTRTCSRRLADLAEALAAAA